MTLHIAKFMKAFNIMFLLVGLLVSGYGFYNGGLKDDNVTLMVGLGFFVASVFISIMFLFMGILNNKEVKK